VSAPVSTYTAQEGDCVMKIDTRLVFIVILYMCTHIRIQFLIVHCSLQVKNKSHDGAANCAFILEPGVVTNSAGENNDGVKFQYERVSTVYVE
jgi:hypothetical protein